MPMQGDPDFNLMKLIAGTAGAVVSLRFVEGTCVQKVFMAVGGAAMSYFATSPMAAWMNAPTAEGVIGFFTGLFGMAIVSKVFEVIALLDAKQMATDVWEFIKRKWGA